ncbi:hypothetical protein [Vibrio mangrovi]|uniref:Uncharacterized protein n=1 Tax=Vibrio mangrovi TaxID=474394 RepID=A0A1Y6INK9_9VIBR|nr:hypothetical protein [Vibrio mangrovi]MDW6003968.1 hypothetical protein [Vibrio mangrovi]SMR99236.1 hypothetical protein VIM7927_00461 [Vibrio mangrovi]
MDRNQIAMIIILGTFSLTVLFTVWLTKRAYPDKRFFWFIGCSVITAFLLGVIQAPISIIASLCILAFIKKENDNPLSDVGSGFLIVIGSGIQLGFFAIYLLLGIGGIYWLWVAIQLKSFMMFLIGIFPLFLIVTAPVGAYSLVFDTPEWILNWFG